MTNGFARATNVVIGASTLIIGLCAYVISTKTTPVFIALFEGMGISFSPMAALSFRLAPFIFPMLIVIAATTLFAAWRRHKNQTPHAPSLVLSIGNLILALYLILQTSIFFDLAIKLPAIIGKLRKGATTQQVAP